MQLEECVNYLLTTAQHSVFLKMTEKLSAFDITPVQYAVLYCLWENDKRSPKEIAERLKLENSTISGILERMEKEENPAAVCVGFGLHGRTARLG